MKKTLLLFVVLLSFKSASAQHSTEAYRELADSLFAHHHYHDAATYYQKAIRKASHPGDMMLQVAKCYGKINRIQEAETWYGNAMNNSATFTSMDTYEYAQVLTMLKKPAEAEEILRRLLRDNPNSLPAREMLSDLEHINDYYRDSSAYTVQPLSFNTAVSEFAPAFYKEGIVFSSATPEHFSRKKYHWDHSDYLNLYYSARANTDAFQKPVLFEEKLNTKFHDGPVVFYENDKKMIVNRNQSVKVENRKDTYMWHLALYDAEYSAENNGWQLNALPFNKSPYAFAHPAINEAGTVLYFTSDMPGGYGGMDIYKVERINGVWGEPFNLGPTINSVENEVFPYFAGSTLYFASNGHGGLGGLDVFKSTQSVNGFVPPVNMGYPVNSSADDFSFIASENERDGYFSSSRLGNDDIFTFHKAADLVRSLAHIFDGETREPLGGAVMQLITLEGSDKTIVADESGNFTFELPANSAYVIVGGKDGKTGMLSGDALKEQDESRMMHEIIARGDAMTEHVVCIAAVEDSQGKPATASEIVIFDETTGEEIDRVNGHTVASFFGEQGHTYRIVAANEQGDTTMSTVTVKQVQEIMKWKLTLKNEAPLQLAARVFNASNLAVLAGAQVQIITFSEADMLLTANAEGVVEFEIKPGTAYMVMASRDNLTGMHSGVAEKGSAKKFITHPVPAYGDAEPKKIPVVGLVINEKGNTVNKAVVNVTDKSTGAEVSAKFENGVLTVLGDKGKSYNITVTSDGHEPNMQEVSISADETNAKKIAVVLKSADKLVPAANRSAIAARIVKATDKSPLEDAKITVISFDEEDRDLIAGKNGEAEFNVAENSAYMIVATRDGFIGTLTGVAGESSVKEKVIHEISASRLEENATLVAGRIIDDNGILISDAVVTVTDRATGKQMVINNTNGFLNFSGEKGKDYVITASRKGHETVTRYHSISSQSGDLEKISIVLKKEPSGSRDIPLAVRVVRHKDKLPLGGASVKVISFSDEEPEILTGKDGVAEFSIPEGVPYMVIATKDGLTGMHSGISEDGAARNVMIHPVVARSTTENEAPAVIMVRNEDGKAVTNAQVTVIDQTTQRKINAEYKNGIISFTAKKGSSYRVDVTSSQYRSESKKITIGKETELETATMVLVNERKASSGSQMIVMRNERGTPNIYIMEGDLFREVTERDGSLFLKNEHGEKNLGNGTINKLANDQAVASNYGLNIGEVIFLQNIYFDYDNATLDNSDKMELTKLSDLLEQHSNLKLVVGAHADDRGRDVYNLNLSKRRAKAVTSYLVKSGVNSSRITQQAFGETLPAVPCISKDCSDDEHQKNRRAEFALTTSVFSSVNNDSPLYSSKSSARYEDLVREYGAKSYEGVTFKISIGAYRYNSSLTFTKLKDLGTLEVLQEDGITYYYLTSFNTLAEAEKVRKQVVERGVSDARVSIFNNAKSISLKKYINLVR